MREPIAETLEQFKQFRVDMYCEGYPDVIFEIILDAPPTQEQIMTAVSALDKFVCRYNKFHFRRPIHDICEIDDLPGANHPRGIYIHIDFGNACPYALLKAVRELEKTDLPIFRVALL